MNRLKLNTTVGKEKENTRDVSCVKIIARSYFLSARLEAKLAAASQALP